MIEEWNDIKEKESIRCYRDKIENDLTTPPAEIGSIEERAGCGEKEGSV